MDDCILHTGATSGGGYGKIKRDGKFWDRHRYEYQKAHGPIPEGMVVRHKCHNKLCYNLNHLVLGTQGDNLQDSINDGRLVRKLTDEQIGAILNEYTGKRGEQSTLARKYGVAPNMINKIVNGKRRQRRVQ